MKKNFIKLMTFALIASGVGVLGSCKDYQEDRMIEIQNELKLAQQNATQAIAGLVEQLNAAKAELQQKIDDAACHCTPVDLSGLQGQINDINDALEALKGQGTITPDNLETAINNALGSYWKAQQVQDAIDEAIANIPTPAPGEPGLTADDVINLVKQTITKKYIIDLIGDHTPAGVSEEKVQEMIDAALVVCDCTAKIDAINTRLDAAEETLSHHADDIAALYNSYSSLAALYATLTGRVDAAEGEINGIHGDINTINGEIELVKGSLAELEAQVLQNQFDINFLDMRVSLLETLTDGIHEEMHQQIEELQAQAAANLAEAKEYADALAKAIADNLEEYQITTDAKIENLEFNVNEIIKSLKILDEWNHDLDAAVEKNAADIKGIQKEIAKIWGEIETIQNYLKSQITGIQVQQTENPVFHGIKLPGYSANVLMGYSAEMNVQPFEFHGEAITSGVVNSENAGKVYLTINPIERDFTGVTLDLVNSQGEKSGIVLTNIKPSDKVLTFGFGTRAQGTPLYEATAEIADPESTKANVDRQALVDALKDFAHNQDKKSLQNLVQTAVRSFQDVAPALGVQAQWTDENGEAHTVVSKLDVMGVTVKPLGYNSFENVSKTNFPRIERVRDFINKSLDKLKKNLAVSISEKFDIRNIEFKTDGITSTIYGTCEGEVVTVDVTDLVEQVFGNMNDAIDNVNYNIDQANDLLATIDGKLNSAYNYTDNLQNRINNILDKVNNGLTKLFDLNQYLQPCLLVSTDNGVISVINGVENKPQVVKGGDITLYPTSYTDEVLCPSYKKFISVEPVGDTKAPKSMLGTPHAVSGSIKEISLPLTEGTWKITFESVDFYGNKVAIERYITVE